ncbi:hypothetical protein IF2G_01945 [Cordyceps javanica]|nr:hypothetical protein IF2G_01945 [Cordyceps javanica]
MLQGGGGRAVLAATDFPFPNQPRSLSAEQWLRIVRQGKTLCHYSRGPLITISERKTNDYATRRFGLQRKNFIGGRPETPEMGD